MVSNELTGGNDMGYYESEEARELRYKVEMEKRCMEDAGLATDDMIKADELYRMTDEEVADEARLMGML